jgi:hypothetical protein
MVNLYCELPWLDTEPWYNFTKLLTDLLFRVINTADTTKTQTHTQKGV